MSAIDDVRAAQRKALAAFEPAADEEPSRPERKLPASVVHLDDMFCGCGDTSAAWDWVKEYLLRLHQRDDGAGWTWKPETGAEYIAAYLLDHLELTEHGSTIRCPWLTDSGREMLAFLEAEGSDWQDKGPWVDADGIGRG
jgi:hypothetical protein